MAFNPALLPANLTGSIASNTSFWPTINAKAPLFGGDFVNNRYMKSGAEVTIGNLFTTQTRASTKQIPDTTGLLTSIATNTMPRTDRGAWIEESRTNLLTYSQDMSHANWSKSDTTITADTVAAPDNTTTADKVTESATTNLHIWSQTVTGVASTTYTMSAYVKAAGRFRLQLQVDNGASNNIYARFNLSTGAVVTTGNGGTGVYANSGITSFGNGYYRVWVTGVPFTAGTTLRALLYILDDSGNGNYAGDGTSGLYFWGAQLEAGYFPSSYIATTSASVTRAADTFNIYPIPTMPHNLLLQSQTFDNASWTRSALNATADTTVAPNGTTTADTLTSNATTTFARAIQTVSLTSGVTYTFSVYIKAGTVNFMQGTIERSGVETSRIYANLAAPAASYTNASGTMASNATITADNNGFYRVAYTFTPTTTASYEIFFGVANAYQSPNTTSGDSIAAWGAMLNTGSTALTYLPTTTVARSTGTLFVEFEAPYLGTANFPGIATLNLNSDTGNNRNSLHVSDGGTDELVNGYLTGGVTQSANSIGFVFSANFC